MNSPKDLLSRYLEYHSKEALHKEPENLYEPIRYIMDLGGKRIRPVFLLLAQQSFGSIDEKGLGAAHAIEMFHNFTLVHDDIMDRADLRRGKTTVHLKWDEATAILSGDQMLIEAFRALRKATGSLSILERFEDVSTEVCEGQRHDMDFENRENVSEEEYFEMIRQKTAVLIAYSLWCGAKVSGADEKLSEKFYDLGVAIGVGFQVMDDLLDCYGDESFGKKIGGDILEGKKTILYIQCLKTASREDKEVLQNWMTTDGKDEERIEGVLSLYGKYQVRDRVTEMMNSFFEQANLIMEDLRGNGNIHKDGLEVLSGFIDSIKVRSV